MQNEFGDAIQFPPNCFLDLDARIVRYESRTLLVTRTPVLEKSFNPVGMMQGGFIVAAIDNTFGPLSYLAARRPCVTLDLHTLFIRPVGPGDTLTVTARVLSRGVSTMVLTAEAHTAKGKLAAQATANILYAPK